MHQTFYIDIDEEITSLIDRLRKSKAKENIFVIPKRALILQSVVNLKVLKKEAAKFKKQIMIVTQDAQGRAISEKVGILSQSSMDGVEESDELKIEIQPKIKSSNKKNPAEKKQKKKVLKNIGSASFYEEENVLSDNESPFEDEVALIEEKPKAARTAKKTAKKSSIARQKERRGTMSDILGTVIPVKSALVRPPSPEEEKKEIDKKESDEEDEENGYDSYEKELDPVKKQELYEFYRVDSGNELPEKEAPVMVHGKTRKIFLLFMIISITAVLITGVFLFMPKAKVSIKLTSRIQSADLEIKADAKNVTKKIEEKAIPVRIIEKEKEKISTFDVSGKNTISDQKARGNIAVYNEFSASPQPLVATTRFMTSDGKIFRLAKGIIVPGIVSVDGKAKPGVIEAEVIADKAGGEFNISPTDFSIPGFEGSPKHSKIYARSSSPMAGGGSKGNEVSVISEADINAAKSKSEAVLKDEIIEEIKSKLENGDVILDDAVEMNILDSYSPEAGTIADKFDFRSKIKIRMMIFSENDLRDVIESSFSKKENEKISQIKIEYGKATSNFGESTALIKVHGKALIEPEVDIAKIKKELLGKNQEEIETLLKDNPEIKGLEAEFWPEFLPGKIPTYEKRVEVEIAPSEF